MAPKGDFNEKKRFINPYNFVPIGINEAQTVDGEAPAGALHTGVLQCRLLTRTPLAVPDAEKAIKVACDHGNPGEHSKYPFFSYEDGIPVIPGSTLRGSIRNMYEAITDSCFSTLRDDSKLITSRTSPSRSFEPGLLINVKKSKEDRDQWQLFRAERYVIPVVDYSASEKDRMTLRELDDIGYGTEVCFRGHEKSATKKYAYSVHRASEGMKLGDNKKGYLYIGEYISKKHYESVFCQSGDQPLPMKNLDKAMEGLAETFRIYNSSAVNKNYNENGRGEAFRQNHDHTGYSAVRKAKGKNVIPVWYQDRGNGRTYLSFACIGRYAYEKTMFDLVGYRRPCTSRKHLCKACALFGMASNGSSLGSRIRITDATLQGDAKNALMNDVMLQELAGPKTSYLPFYTGNGMTTKILTYDQNAQIRGRKFYWHSEFKDAGPGAERTQRNATMQLVKAGEEFLFQVYYDRITDTELKELIWALTLGENMPDSHRCHKIGHGKPLGLGSAKIVINRQQERLAENGYRLEDVPVEPADDVFVSSQIKSAVLKLVNMDTTKDRDVCYPIVMSSAVRDARSNSNEDAGHRWFSANYKGKKPAKYSLPDAAQKDLTLPAYDLSLPGGGSSGNGRDQGQNGNRGSDRRFGGSNYGQGNRKKHY